MTAQLIPAAGRDGSSIPRPRTGSDGPVTSGATIGVRPQPGESDPARMLSGVLVLVVLTIILTLTLVLWLV